MYSMSETKEDFEFEPLDVTEYVNQDYQIVPSNNESKEITTSGITNDTQEDYETARKTYHELVQKGQSALDELLNIASSSEAPRAYEVAAQMIKTISDTNDRIMELQNQMRKLSEQDAKQERTQDGTTINNNAVFVGSMNDFQQFIKELRKKGKSTKIEDNV